MQKALLLERLNGLVTRYQQHRGYIEKARIQAASGKFNPQVIEKVLLDHEIKASTVADDVGPLLPNLQTLIDALVEEKGAVHSGNAGVDEAVQELELRAAIGELSDEDFNSEVAGLRGRLDAATERITSIDGELNELQSALDGWAALAGPHGHYVAPVAAVVAAAPVVQEVVAPRQVAAEPEFVFTPTVVEDEPVTGGMSEDIGAAFTDSPVSSSDDVAIEAAEGSDMDDVGMSEEVSFGADEAVGGVVASTEVEIDLGGDGPVVSGNAISKEAAGEPPKDDDSPRRALLLYQEGTAEEQIYPFTNDALTIGRGRENDIQIKNDSKVSRYHCKLQRRGSNFYIEDAKSSNGTLVNGELITDRRLFGGEEIIIGETFFRFRIME
jgi:hypothetical protein